MIGFSIIDNFDTEFVLDKDIGELKIAMNDIVFMEKTHPITHKEQHADLGEEGSKIPKRLNPKIQRFEGIEIHHQVVITLFYFLF